jgi:hypothetical protein
VTEPDLAPPLKKGHLVHPSPNHTSATKPTRIRLTPSSPWARPLALLGATLALVFVGCSTARGDLESACELGLTSLQPTVTEAEIQACASTDEAILNELTATDRSEAEDCVACVARTHLHEALCFHVCEAGACAPYGLGACENECGGQGLRELCARGGVPAQHTELR